MVDDRATYNGIPHYLIIRPRVHRSDSRYNEAIVSDQQAPAHIQRKINDNAKRIREEAQHCKMSRYNPASDPGPFTKLEQLTFALAFKDTPMEFDKVAEVLPGRTMRDCMAYYYEGMADGRLDLDSIEVEIQRLRRGLPDLQEPYCKTPPPKDFPTTVIPRCELSLLQLSFQPPLVFATTEMRADDELLKWLRSDNVLPLLKQWWNIMIDEAELLRDIRRRLPPGDKPWNEPAKQIAHYARWLSAHDLLQHLEAQQKDKVVPGPVTRRLVESTPAGELSPSISILISAYFAMKIAHANGPVLKEVFHPYSFTERERYLAATRALLATYSDLQFEKGDNGFFAQLFKTKLAGPMTAEARNLWESKFAFAGELPGLCWALKTDEEEKAELEIARESNTKLSQQLQAIQGKLEEREDEVDALKSQLESYRNRYG